VGELLREGAAAGGRRVPLGVPGLARAERPNHFNSLRNLNVKWRPG